MRRVPAVSQDINLRDILPSKHELVLTSRLPRSNGPIPTFFGSFLSQDVTPVSSSALRRSHSHNSSIDCAAPARRDARLECLHLVYDTPSSELVAFNSTTQHHITIQISSNHTRFLCEGHCLGQEKETRVASYSAGPLRWASFFFRSSRVTGSPNSLMAHML